MPRPRWTLDLYLGQIDKTYASDKKKEGNQLVSVNDTCEDRHDLSTQNHFYQPEIMFMRCSRSFEKINSFFFNIISNN